MLKIDKTKQPASILGKHQLKHKKCIANILHILSFAACDANTDARMLL